MSRLFRIESRHFSTSEKTRKSSWLVWLVLAWLTTLDRFDWLLLQNESSFWWSKLMLEFVAESFVLDDSVSLMEELEDMVEDMVVFLLLLSSSSSSSAAVLLALDPRLVLLFLPELLELELAVELEDEAADGSKSLSSVSVMAVRA